MNFRKVSIPPQKQGRATTVQMGRNQAFRVDEGRAGKSKRAAGKHHVVMAYAMKHVLPGSSLERRTIDQRTSVKT
jgi:hypothetical protein